MILNTCKAIEEHLVDYTDKLLDSDASKRIAEHLRQCEGCQRKADALDRSLALTHVIWQDSLEQAQKHAATRLLRPQLMRWTLRGTAAAIVLITSLVALRYRPSHPASPPLTAEHVEFQIEVEAADHLSESRLPALARAHEGHGRVLSQSILNQ